MSNHMEPKGLWNGVVTEVSDNSFLADVTLDGNGETAQVSMKKVVVPSEDVDLILVDATFTWNIPEEGVSTITF